MSSVPPQGLRFGAVGDVVLSGRTATAIESHGDAWPFARVAPALARAELLFGNLECVVRPPDFPREEVDARGLTTTVDAGRVLGAAGFSVVSLANNHVLDGGTSSMLHTRDLLERHGVAAVGVGATQAEARSPVVLERGGLRWAFLAYAEDSNYTLSTSGPCHAYYDPGHVVADVRAARADADVVVVSIHADLEFTDVPSPARRAAFREIAGAGATLVLGHHPHVVQGMERVGSSLVVYSLGNVVSHARSSPYLSAHLPATALTFLLLADVDASGVGAVERVPIAIGPLSDERPVLLEGGEATALRERLERLDAAVADDVALAAAWRRTALRHGLSATQRLGAARTEEELVHGLGSLLWVAENRAWVDEVVKASAERWTVQRAWSDQHHRPSWAAPVARPPRSARRQVGRALRRGSELISRARWAHRSRRAA